ncbi:uncharacterized protein LOC117648166 [Thrips palmi]|uniref:Uncharacterized protein LOC117648166 n=1 Tax=Thrips palmi TaxID=161013 RepID=A0A6P8Z819_THRPL|nr:uncharacterized protein LOC117648166 [Thrips palmi]XP_034246321.1 uncharacterized protein LOC117648166 [Thrips palmi]XP_034246322.1 uncharacterized protein LOC117648166 [Thrips palmi]XP_034246323.1 uncharacterized protein LOC117648166 [Thrips palmi]XP_034246324.1 uncharacterized protein LOC117648166 [Thrips palmi]XP_034246325.1 uncharacterized protein LOC117648166 [Thrips palmi]XP_034246326.1 uncharacterized protein LOC117648166 [Thrips palmi]XP_034246327.1 uncharacterized protein LOC1176
MSEKDGKRVVTFGPKSGECAVCDKVGTLKCSRCQVDFYCGKDHQVQDWPRHRQICGCMELRVSPEVGRCVVATKDIPMGTILMREIPLVATPNFGSDEDQPLCVGCFMPPHRVRACALCGWPVCSEACSKKEIHQPECAAFQRAKFKLPKGKLTAWESRLWSYLAALRTTLAFEDKARRDILESLQYENPPVTNMVEEINKLPPAGRMRLMTSHSEFELACSKAAEWVRDVAGMTWLSAEKVRRAAGVCYINSTGCGSSSGRHVTGLFAGMSLVEHSCRHNVETQVWQRVGDPHPMAGVAGSLEYVLVATRDIARGEHLALGYLPNYLEGAAKRRMALLYRNFLCRCELCSDPSQRGLYLEGWCCRSCSAKKKKAFPVLIRDLDNNWACSGCGDKGPLVAFGAGATMEIMANMFRSVLSGGVDSMKAMAQNPAGIFDSVSTPGGADTPYDQSRSLERRLKALLESSSKVPLKEWERFISDALWPRGPLHPTHSLVLQAKNAIIEMDQPDVLVARLTAAETKRLVGYCRDLLAVCDEVCPGASSFRAQILCIQSGLIGAQVMARLNDTGRSGPRPDTEALLDEWEAVHNELLVTALCPKGRDTTLRNLDHVAQIRKNLAMMKRR